MPSRARCLLVLASVSLLLACAVGAEAVQRRPEAIKVNRRLLSSSNWAHPSVDTANKLAGWEAMPQEQSAADAIERHVAEAMSLDSGARKLLAYLGRHGTPPGRYMPGATTNAISEQQADVEAQEAVQERDAESDASNPARKLRSTFAAVHPTLAFGKAADFSGGGITNQESDTADAIDAAELTAERIDRP